MQQLAFDFSHLKAKKAAAEAAPKNNKNARLTLRRLSSAEYPGLRRLSVHDYPVLKRLASAGTKSEAPSEAQLEAQANLEAMKMADELEMQGLCYAEYPGLFE